MRALIFLVAIVLLLALAGWISFSSSAGRSSINLETQQIEADTNRALESGAQLLERASDSMEPEAPVEQKDLPPVSEPIRVNP